MNHNIRGGDLKRDFVYSDKKCKFELSICTIKKVQKTLILKGKMQFVKKMTRF